MAYSCQCPIISKLMQLVLTNHEPQTPESHKQYQIPSLSVQSRSMRNLKGLLHGQWNVLFQSCVPHSQMEATQHSLQR